LTEKSLKNSNNINSFNLTSNDTINSPKIEQKKNFEKLKINMLFYLFNFFHKYEVKNLRNTPINKYLKIYTDKYIDEYICQINITKLLFLNIISIFSNLEEE